MNQYFKSFGRTICIVMVVSCHTSSTGTNKTAGLVTLSNQERGVSGRIFPVLTAANEKQAEWRKLNDKSHYGGVAVAISARYEIALNECNSLACLANAFKITENEVEVIVSALPGNTGSGPLNYQSGKSLTDAIRNEISALNNILDVYLGIREPRYPKIDKASRLADAQGYLTDLKKEVGALHKKAAANGTFYHLPWLTALKVLSLNGRDEAGRYEPLNNLNQAALKKVKSVDWTRFRFSAMLVPGLGPQKPGIALDRGGAKRCDLAAEQYKKGLAPFIIVSGGHVHPDKTPYSEGIEMKKYLVDKLRIPASAIIVEPYARHTTTNIRNAARLIYQLGLPQEMPVAIVTDIGQATYVMFMKGRFLEELGYLPYQELSKAKAGLPYFVPSRDALQINPMDPLDP